VSPPAAEDNGRVDAAQTPPELELELAELRRRAYGPHADIATDAAAIARLIELESLFSRRGRSSSRPPTLSESEPIAPEPASTQATFAPPTTAPKGSAPATLAAVRRRRRGATVVAMLSALVLVPVVIATSLASGSSGVTLRPRGDVPPEAAAELAEVGQLDYMGITASDVQLYDHYRGLNVWSAQRSADTICLFVTSTEPPRWRVDCAPRGGRPTIDLMRYRGDSRLAGFEALGDVPPGHVLRLALQDGAVVVDMVEIPTVLAHVAG
jgi:hypothetical protein